MGAGIGEPGLDSTAAPGDPRAVTVVPMPPSGEWYADARSGDRALRVSWHAERDCVVLSTWKDGVCTGTARLGPRDAARLVGLLADGLAGLAGAQSGTDVAEATQSVGA